MKQDKPARKEHPLWLYILLWLLLLIGTGLAALGSCGGIQEMLKDIRQGRFSLKNLGMTLVNIVMTCLIAHTLWSEIREYLARQKAGKDKQDPTAPQNE